MSDLLSFINSVGSGSGSSTSNSGANGAINQTERLFTTRARGPFINPQAGGDRGTRAYIKLMNSNSNPLSNLASSLMGSGSAYSQALNGGNYGGYANFLVTRVQGTFDEKIQIVQTLGDGEVVYYFGREPMMFSIGGLLVDSVDNAWFTDWLSMYGQVMRGTQLAMNGALLQLVLPNMVLVGTMANMSFDMNSNNDVLIPFNFTFQVKQITPTGVTGISAPMSNLAQSINFSTSANFLSQQGINSLSSGFASQLTGAGFGGLMGSASGISALGGGLGGTSALSTAIDGITAGLNGFSTDVNSMFVSVMSNLNGIASSILSPVFGVLTSLTKMLKAVQADVASVFNLLVSPVASVIRDVISLENAAMSVLGLFNSTVNEILGLPNAIGSAYNSMFTTLENTTGCLVTQLTSMTFSASSCLSSGIIPANSYFLSNVNSSSSLSTSITGSLSKIALLTSAPPPNVSTGATL